MAAFSGVKVVCIFYICAIIITVICASESVQSVEEAEDGRVSRRVHRDKSDAEISDLPEDKRSALIQEAVKSLLGMKELPLPPASGDRKERSGRGTLPSPPRYMFQLYNSYKSGNMPEEKRKGNTVRSILPMRGKIAGDDVLVFNLTGVHPLEQILQGELHLFKRKKVKGGKRQRLLQHTSGLRLQLFNFTYDNTPIPTYVHVPLGGHGWQSYNVTQAVTSCRQADHKGPHLLGVKMEAQKPNGQYKYLPLGRVMKLNTQPFLIVFSEDRVNQTIEEEIEELADVKGEGLSLLNDSSSVLHRPRPRSKRSLLDNELPDDPLHTNQIPRTAPENMLQAGREKHRKIDPGLIPYPTNLKKKPFMQPESNTKQKRKRKNRRLPQTWQQKQRTSNDANEAFLEVPEGDHPPKNPHICQKKKLVVDFTDIGWNDWIIAPKSFETHYCTGTCPFPISNHLKFSNHAMIQSLIHAAGIHPDVPAPCCVPDSTSSLTLLYMDEQLNVILKNYRQMIVHSCGCR